MVKNKIPWGAQLVDYIFHLIPHFSKPEFPNISYKVIVWILVYVTYMFYHMARKSFSIVKPVLAPNCSSHHDLNDSDYYLDDNTGWAPFSDSDHCKTLLGSVDYSFAFSYGASLYFSGIIADRVNVRYYLTFGLIVGGVTTGLLGVAYFAEIHHLYFFILVQILNGMLQSTGWPAVMAVMGNWFGRFGRGSILGIWNSHVFVGNIIGTFISGTWAKNPEDDWGWSFIVPGFIMVGMGGVIFLFLVIDPKDIDLPSPKHNNNMETADNGSINTKPHGDNEKQPLLLNNSSSDSRDTNSCLYRVMVHGGKDGAVGIVQALKIPGVIEFSLSLLFMKLVNYVFLFWLPFYIKHHKIHNDTLSNIKSFHFSMLFDVGGIIGGVGIGILSDLTGARALTCVFNQYLSIPILYLYSVIGEKSDVSTIVMLLVIGYFINGPISLTATAVSSDLGTHKSLLDNQKAKATVSAFINATGTIGAAFGPLVAGLLSDSYGWNSVFYLLMASSFTSALCLSRLVIKDCFMLKQKATLFFISRT